MRTHSSTLTCTSCGRAATLTVTETRPRTRPHSAGDDGVLGYSMVFECDSHCQPPSDAALRELWAGQRA